MTDVRIDAPVRIDAADRSAVTRLIARATEADGVSPVSEPVVLHLRHGDDHGVQHLLAWRGEDLVGYGHLDNTDSITGSTAEVVVDPDAREQGIGRAMAAAGRGSIVNVTSAAAEVHRGNGVPYGASKCALEYLTRAFALELGPSGVRVNSARPGFAEGSAGNPMPGGYAEAIRARSLMGALGTPADFANGVMFLCSDDARFMTGSVLDCGGGGHINRRAGAATAARG